jgi:hypothetical protein
LSLKELNIKIFRTKGLVDPNSGLLVLEKNTPTFGRAGTWAQKTKTRRENKAAWISGLIVCIYVQDSKSERVNVACGEELYLVRNDVVETKSCDKGS